MVTRRRWIAGAMLTVGATVFDRTFAGALTADFGSLEPKIAALEKSSGGRLGVAVLDTGSGARFGYRATERFPMCSTFKLLAVSAVLTRVDQGKESLGRVVHYTQQDLLEYAPVTKLHVGTGMPVSALCEAAITWSDNTAANLLVNTIGGPAGVTAFARKLGDGITRLDRNEPALNEALPDDPRDTSTPLAMLTNLRRLALGNTLAPASRARLLAWLVANKTGDKRLRAGFPGYMESR